MLRPYVCVVCEKVIVSQDGVASLISLFDKMIVKVPVDHEIPQNAVAPREWHVFSAWDHEPGDENIESFLCTQVLYPDQSPFGPTGRLKINVEPNKRSQIAVQMVGFPLGQSGLYTVKTWVEQSQRVVIKPICIKIDLQIVRE